MAAVYPVDYPFNVNSEGWPEPVYAPSYPFEHYYDNGRNPRQIQLTSESKNDDTNFKLPLAIRRHTPGSTDPNPQQLSSRSLSPRTKPSITVNQHRSQFNRRSASIRNHSSASVDPDERPIKPMKDTSIYKQSTGQKKKFQPKKLPPQTLKPIQSSPRYEPDPFQSPLPSSRTPMSYVSGRRPVRTDLIPKTPFGIPPPPPPRTRSRRIIVEEYDDDDDDDDDDHYYYPVTYVKSVPHKILSYQPVSGMTTRELENYQMSKVRRVVRVRSPPVERIIYQN